LFLDGIEPFLGHPFSVAKTTKRASIFDLGPLKPKIYSPKLLAIRLHFHVATRGRALGSSALPGESRQSTELVAMATKFGLGAEIQSPTGLFLSFLFISALL